MIASGAGGRPPEALWGRKTSLRKRIPRGVPSASFQVLGAVPDRHGSSILGRLANSGLFDQAGPDVLQGRERGIARSSLNLGDVLRGYHSIFRGLISVRSVVRVYPGPLNLRDSGVGFPLIFLAKWTRKQPCGGLRGPSGVAPGRLAGSTEAPSGPSSSLRVRRAP